MVLKKIGSKNPCDLALDYTLVYNQEMSSFYDKVAKKFGYYRSGAKRFAEYPDDDPEKIFKEKLLSLSGKDKIALDAGCGDGRFTLSIAPHFGKIIAIDASEKMLAAAQKFKKEKQVKNVDFKNQDAHHIDSPEESFDIIYSRRGPTFYSTFYKLLKKGGYFVNINIGEKDAQELKTVFGRGQNYGGWNKSRLEKEKKKIIKSGYKVVFAKEYFYNEYYASYKDLDLFLQAVPIFEDFDSQKDEKFLKKYVSAFQGEKGIKLPRHRIVLVIQK